jgi:FkbM family methyltransferase
MFIFRIIKLCQIILDPFLVSALMKSATAGTEHISVLRNLACDFVVDIGANRGQFALVARKCYPSAKIISFEPLAEPASVFRRVFAGDPLTTLHQMAIGSQEQEIDIHVSSADDSSSLLPITSMQTGLFPGTGEKETRKIQVKRLDSILHPEDIGKPSLLKIDVQGFEKQVLEGCSSLLQEFTFIYVECSFVELYANQSLAPGVIFFLADCGFALSGIYNVYYDKQGVAIQGDFLFKNNSV